MGITAEKVAERMEGQARRSGRLRPGLAPKALAAIEAGEFKDEIAPFKLDDRYPDLADSSVREDNRLIDTDEGPRPDTSAEGLAKLRTVFRKASVAVTAGNSSQMSDGAGARDAGQ